MFKELLYGKNANKEVLKNAPKQMKEWLARNKEQVIQNTNNAKKIGLENIFENVERRNIVSYGDDTYKIDKTAKLGYIKFEDDFLNKCTLLNDIKYQCKLPFVDINNIAWKRVGYHSDLSSDIQSKMIQPKRITARIKVSMELLKQSQNFDKQLLDIIASKMKLKVFETMFNDGEGDDDTPKGILNGVEAVELSDINDLLDLKYSGDIMQSQNSFILSPLAQREIYKMKDGNLINDGKLFGADCYNINQLKDGYVIYCPLDMIVVGQWSYLSYTENPYGNNPIEGLLEIVVDGYYDFAFLNNQYLKVGYFSTTSDTSSNENGNSENNENSDTNEEQNDGE